MREGRRSRVLVVEDRPGVLKVLASILEARYEVTTAGDGAAALQALGAGIFEVVLTDIRMPGLSGFEVLRAARTCAPAPSVVMMTAYANVPDAVAAIKLGACDYVAKPVDADEIALVVARAVEQRRGVPEGPGATLLASSRPAGAEPAGVDPTLAFRSAVEAARDAASRRYLVGLMSAFQWNVTRAAAQAGMTRESLHRVLRKYDVRPELGKSSSALVEPDEGPSGQEGRG
jgi:DNA-binding NtrC family response regulator